MIGHMSIQSHVKHFVSPALVSQLGVYLREQRSVQLVFVETQLLRSENIPYTGYCSGVGQD